jgi:cbb3-type cytochrome oxidase subunit 3
MSELNIPVSIIWLINSIILCAILILVYFFVFRDERKKRTSLQYTLVWTFLSIFTFPLCFLFYLLVMKNKTSRSTAAKMP